MSGRFNEDNTIVVSGTAPIVVTPTRGNGRVIGIAPATPTSAGAMTAAQAALLAGATQNNTPSTLVWRDSTGAVAFAGFNGGFVTPWASITSIGSFGSSWNNEPTSPVVQYRRDALGFVHLRGVAYRSTGTAVSNEVMFSLPAGFVPTSVVELFQVITNTGAGQVNVNSDGTVRWRSGGIGYLSLSGIMFEVVAP